MTVLSKVISLYSMFILFLFVCIFIDWIHSPRFIHPFLIIFTIYFLPVLTYRIHSFFYKSKEGFQELSELKYNAWWGNHQLQLIYISFPFLESLLILIPGCYSAWLRLWGSKIGKNVYWTPLVRIEDRHLIDVGNGVVFGHKVECYSHVVTPKDKKIILYQKKITIGDHAFLGAGVRIGPGVTVSENTFIPVLTDLSPPWVKRCF